MFKFITALLFAQVLLAAPMPQQAPVTQNMFVIANDCTQATQKKYYSNSKLMIYWFSKIDNGPINTYSDVPHYNGQPGGSGYTPSTSNAFCLYRLNVIWCVL